MENTAVFAVLLALLGTFAVGFIGTGWIVYKVWRENPGIITKSFYPGPDRRPSSRVAAPAPQTADGAPRAVSSKGISASGTSKGKTDASSPDLVAPGDGTRGAVGSPSQAGGRRRTSTAAKPTMDENKVFDWEIDPKKLKMKYAVGKGNFGEVWLATWLGSPVAVKTIVPELQNKEKLVKRFIDEILLMSMLHHPNVVLFLGACTKRPNLCLVLEYCVHGSLHHFLKTEHEHGIRITMSLIYRFALDIARGVYYLHRRCKVVQRDLKARNILVDESLNAKVADFGLSRVMDESEKNKLTACGTPAWTAPEIVKMEAYTEKVDVYSFGIIMWELITRQEPYGGQKGVQIAYAAAEQGLRPEIPAYCPPDYADLMRQCWSDDPNDRPEFSAILKKLFQLKKACDIAAAASLAEGDGAGVEGSRILAPTLPPVAHRRGGGGGDSDGDDSGDDAIPIVPRAAPQRPPGPRAPTTKSITVSPKSATGVVSAAATSSSAAASAATGMTRRTIGGSGEGTGAAGVGLSRSSGAPGGAPASTAIDGAGASRVPTGGGGGGRVATGSRQDPPGPISPHNNSSLPHSIQVQVHVSTSGASQAQVSSAQMSPAGGRQQQQQLAQSPAQRTHSSTAAATKQQQGAQKSFGDVSVHAGGIVVTDDEADDPRTTIAGGGGRVPSSGSVPGGAGADHQDHVVSVVIDGHAVGGGSNSVTRIDGGRHSTAGAAPVALPGAIEDDVDPHAPQVQHYLPADAITGVAHRSPLHSSARRLGAALPSPIVSPASAGAAGVVMSGSSRGLSVPGGGQTAAAAPHHLLQRLPSGHIDTATVQREVDRGVVNLRAAKGGAGDWDGSVSSGEEDEEEDEESERDGGPTTAAAAAGRRGRRGAGQRMHPSQPALSLQQQQQHYIVQPAALSAVVEVQTERDE